MIHAISDSEFNASLNAGFLRGKRSGVWVGVLIGLFLAGCVDVIFRGTAFLFVTADQQATVMQAIGDVRACREELVAYEGLRQEIARAEIRVPGRER